MIHAASASIMEQWIQDELESPSRGEIDWSKYGTQ